MSEAGNAGAISRALSKARNHCHLTSTPAEGLRREQQATIADLLTFQEKLHT